MRALAGTGSEIKLARLAAGLSLREVGRAVGLSYSQVGRIERATHLNVSLVHLIRICSVVGLDLSVRAYPGARPIRDIAHIALLQRLRERLHNDLRLHTEVPLAIEGDRRAWDAMIRGRDAERVAVEAETRIADFQSLARRIALKQRDDAIDRVILLVAASRTNREAVRAAEPFISETFALDTRATLSELGEGRLPSRSSLVFL
jgi:transcriptional regulator with XRE-family HTH domain